MVQCVKCLLCREILERRRNETTNLLEHVKEKHPDIQIERVPVLSEKQNPYQPRKIAVITSEFTTDEVLKDALSIATNINEEKFTKINSNSCSSSSTNLSNELPHIEEPPTTNQYAIKQDYLDKMIIETLQKNDFACKCDSTNKQVSPDQNEPQSMVASEVGVDNVPDDRKFELKKPFKPPVQHDGKKAKFLYQTSIEKWRPGSSKIYCPDCGVTKRPIIRSHANRAAHSSVGAACLLACWPFCFLPYVFPPPTQEFMHCALCGYYFGMYDHRKGFVKPNM